jgi:biotin synthase
MTRSIDREFILRWLQETDEKKLQELWSMADETRKKYVGNEVHLRGLIELSNYCVRKCAYCGLNVERGELSRYRMERQEILDCAAEATEYGYGTVVMQAGEDYGLTREFIADVVSEIKARFPLAVTLSLGERPLEDIKAWREAGADRYLLRFETSNSELYKIIHPPLPKDKVSRVDMLRYFKEIGLEAGSGIMVGIPGQTYDIVADDIELFRELDLDMVGIGPYIPHEDTPLYHAPKAEVGQVPNTELMAYKAVALTRLLCPEANIPSTTALATLNRDSGRENGLNRGANVVMPNITPLKYRALYEIYPSKVCINETANDCRHCIKGRIYAIGRETGSGHGNRVKTK